MALSGETGLSREIEHLRDELTRREPGTEFGFLLHDVGKVAIPDAILDKASSLTEKERALMAQHPLIFAGIIRGIEFLGEAANVVRSHGTTDDGFTVSLAGR